METACESSEDDLTRERVSRGPMARTEHQACRAGMGVSVWRDAVVGRGLVGCSWMWVGSRGQAEQVGGTGEEEHEHFAPSMATEKLVSPCTLFQREGEACFVSPARWELGAKAGVGRGRDGAERLWGGIYQVKRGAV